MSALGLVTAAGRAFLRAWIGAFVPLLLGVLAAPNLDQAYGLGVAAMIAATAAAIRVLQEFVPQISFVHWISSPYATWVDSFARAFVGSLVITLPGVLDAPDVGTAKGLAIAVVIGAFTAGVRAIQGLLTPGDVPVAGGGPRTAGAGAVRPAHATRIPD